MDEISSAGTIFYKFILPLISIFHTYLFIIYEFSIVLLFFSIVFFLLSFLVYDLKVVSYENNKLLISNFFKEIEVDRSEVLKVSHRFKKEMRPEIIEVKLKNKTIFGRRIFFIAKDRTFIRGIHPIVDELTKMINENQSSA